MRTSEKAKRHNLYMLRCDNKLTQAKFAAKIGVSCRGYQNVEWGERDGTAGFWAAIQRVFNIPDSEMYSLMKLEVKECETHEQ